ncbi:MAG: metallophosphoesterase family protein [Chloroflexi bacterium]|nr:metallophosphoesterase family protein [Chloroflexota bacterium]
MLESHHRLALIADLHGHIEILLPALELCHAEKVDALVFLGDLIDRADQADACVNALRDWRAYGVSGNHEAAMLAALAQGADLKLKPETIQFIRTLEPRLIAGDVCFLHDELEEPRADPLQKFFARETPRENGYRVLFVGHTHHRAARSDNGPLDVSHNITLDPNREYVINPGALVGGMFAIWDRAERVVRFKQVK